MTEDAIFTYTVNESTQEEIEKHLSTCNKDFVKPLSERINIKNYSEKIQKNSITFEAWSDNELIGLIACYANDPNKNVAFITNVSVLSNYRKKGIAQALFKALFKNKIILRFNRIEIKVFKNDIPTINLYAKNGFKVKEQDDEQIIMEHVFFNQNPLVSISCITYNHRPYIRQCLDGFIMQKTTFPIEVLIHDDASTDGTTNIIREYETNYPDIIKPTYQTENQYSKGIPISATFNWPKAKGKYIAMCEGDDFWTDPLKLQKQVDVLEKNPDINICSHPSKRLYDTEIKKDGYGYWGDQEKIISAKEVIGNYASTAPLQSIMFRNKEIEKISEITKNLLGGHSSLQIFYSLPNGLYYIPEYMSVYRVESASSISKILFKNDKGYLARQKKNWKGLDLLNESSNYAFDKDFKHAKQIRALNAIRSGFLKGLEIWSLVREYSLYLHPLKLGKAMFIHYKLKQKR